jgi:hypothetical protein
MPRGEFQMAKAAGRRTPGSGPLMTLVALIFLLLPVLSLGAWLTMTPDGRASWQASLQQTAIDK